MTAVCVCLCFLIYTLCKRLQGVRVNNKEKARWHSFESKNTTGTGPLNVSQPDTHKPANAEAEFKQSMQCCSQWGLTSRSRLWNVERSMIKTAERARCRAHTYLSTHSSSAGPSELSFPSADTHISHHVYCEEFTSYLQVQGWCQRSADTKTQHRSDERSCVLSVWVIHYFELNFFHDNLLVLLHNVSVTSNIKAYCKTWFSCGTVITWWWHVVLNADGEMMLLWTGQTSRQCAL